MTIRFSGLACMGGIALILALAGCGGGNGDTPAGSAIASSDATLLAKAVKKESDDESSPAKNEPHDNPLAIDVGEALFKDPSLSSSGKMACVTCHGEQTGHADAVGVKLPMGGMNLDVSGMRSSPTVRYLNEGFPFKIDKDGVPSGGFTWDGRADSRQEQARAPFFEPQEMNLPGTPDEPKALTDKVRAATYFADLKRLYTPAEISTDKKLLDRITQLISIYQRDDADYNLFDSRYDRWLKGTTTLTTAEMNGLAVFKDPAKGNCISCHGSQGAKQLFTNFGYAALGAPRNHAGPKNTDAAFFDLGLCTRDRATAAQKSRDDKGENGDDDDNNNDDGKKPKKSSRDDRYCGMFKTPTLRNIDRTAPYFHNASVPTLEAAVRFHFDRDLKANTPDTYYRKKDGSPDRAYNDLPTRHLGNVAKGKPFDGSSVLAATDFSDLITFLKALTDSDQE